MIPTRAGWQGGFTYIGAMVAVIILGITLGATGTYWQTRMQREREAELLFRGIQYRDAIRAWYGFDPKTGKVNPLLRTRRNLPPNAPPLNDLEHLLKDPNSTTTVRYLRKLYQDPFTGEDFLPVKGANQEIIGVKSASEAAPLKQANFPDSVEDGLEPADFEGKQKYSDWTFIYNRVPRPTAKGTVTGIKTSSTSGGSTDTSTSGGTSKPGAP